MSFENRNKTSDKSGASDHFKWCCNWYVDKWHNEKEKTDGVKPYETVHAAKNMVLDVGANEMLKLIFGTGGTAYNSANAKICVGTSAETEQASQIGCVGTSSSVGMDDGYPVVNDRTATLSATFDSSRANFAWREVSITNGSVALNRRVSSIGTKNGDVWTARVYIDLLSE
jgi:hypothetical protein